MAIPVAKLLYSCKYKLNNNLRTKVSIPAVVYPASIAVKESTLHFADNMHHHISLPFLYDVESGGSLWRRKCMQFRQIFDLFIY